MPLRSTFNYLVPATGTTHLFDVSQVFSATPVQIDWRTVELDGDVFIPSGIFVDNTLGAGDLIITITGIAYRIVVPAGRSRQVQYPAPADQIVTITGNGQATVIFVDFPVIPFEAGGGSSGTSVTIADGADAALGAQADAPAANDTGAFSLISLFKRLLSKFPVIGPHIAADSLAVTLATDDPQIGTKVTAVPALGAGGTGIIGWLSDMANQIATRIYPRGAVQLAASTTGAAAPLTATLVAAATGTTAYCTGFEITGSGATAASVIAVTLTGGAAVQNYRLAIPAGVALGIEPLFVALNPPFPASAINTNIVLSAPSFGAGNTDAALNIRGFRI